MTRSSPPSSSWTRSRMIAEPRMWPGVEERGPHARRDLALLLVVDRPEVLERRSASLTVYSGASRSISRCGGWARRVASGSRGQPGGSAPRRRRGPRRRRRPRATRRRRRPDRARPRRTARTPARRGRGPPGRSSASAARRPRPRRGGASPSAPRAWRTPRGGDPVEQHERRQLDRPGRGVDRAPVAVLDEQRQSPQWSRCAWVRTTASSVDGSNPNGIRLRIDSLGLPWNIPQSMRTRARSVVSRNCEPVTVVAPPRNWMCMAAW